MQKEPEFLLALDVSTSTIGIALFEDLGTSGELKLLHHVSPKVKPKPENKMEELFRKVEIFEQEFLVNYANKLKKETFDTSDAYVAGIGYMYKHEIWKHS